MVSSASARRVTAFAIGGPTASGKSAVALELAEQFGFEIVSADAMQVYRGLDVGTAKPTLEERTRVLHHMIDVVPASSRFSVADWVVGAEDAILEAFRRGVTCLVVGGTGFYLDALARGLPTTPAADEAVQAVLYERLEQEGLDVLVASLEAKAPLDAMRAARNPRRVIRALEILERSGKPPSAFDLRPPRVSVQRVWLVPSMGALDPRIEARAKNMLAEGLVEEAAGLDSISLATASQAIGYREAAAVARGELSFDEAYRAIVMATRQYAKRQRTWFQGHEAEWMYPNLATEVQDALASWLAGARSH